jgi:hypothetical protein
VRKHIPTAEIFASYGDKWEDVQIISKTEMESYPLSRLIRLAGTKDVYYIEGTAKRWVPSVSVFNKYGMDWNKVIDVNRKEFDFYRLGDSFS